MYRHIFSKQARILALMAYSLFLSAQSRAAVIDFEDLGLDTQSEWHGPDPNGTTEQIRFPSGYVYTYTSGKFTSGGADFHNNCDAFSFWSGWAYSNMTYNPNNYMPGDYNPGDGSNGNPHPVPTGSVGQYNAAPGGNAGGSSGSANYGICYTTGDTAGTAITLPSPTSIQGALFSNNNYAYYSMMEGDPPDYGYFAAKKFTAEDHDYFRLLITGKDSIGNAVADPAIFYLADFRDPSQRTDNPRKDNYIVDQWTWVDLSSFGDGVKSLEFDFESSDYDPNGILTPMYFVMDNLATGPKPLWSGSLNNKWSNSSNWTSGQAPGSGQNIVFSNNNNTNIDLDGNRHIANITFDSAAAGSFTFIGGALTLDAGASITIASTVAIGQTFNCNLHLAGNGFLINNSTTPGQSLIVAGDINSAAAGGMQNLILGGAGKGFINGTIEDGASGGKLAILKQDAGDWTLDNDVFYSGNTVIQDGLLQFNGDISSLNQITGDGELGVGDGVNASIVYAEKIRIGTLNVAHGSKLVICPLVGRPLAGDHTLKTVPEPNACILIVIAALGLFVRKARPMVAALHEKKADWD